MKLWLQRCIGLLLSVLLSGVPAAWGQSMQPPAPSASDRTGPAPAPITSLDARDQEAGLPDSPGYTQLQAQVQPASSSAPNSGQPSTQPQSPPSAATQTQPPAQSTEQAPASSPTAPDQNAADQNPAGAAAAQRGKTAGGAASRPAGAALAPAKQRHPRSLLVKLGVIAGAGAALGTVFALSQAGGSRPPGAH